MSWIHQVKNNRFKNKVIWITGASSGIGEALTYALHGFFDSIRSEVYRDNIRIVIIIPGIIKTAIIVNALMGDGSKYGKMEKVQEQGISPAKCAKKILNVISKGKEEVLIGGPEILTVYIRRFFPTIFSKIIRNHPIKKLNQIRRIFHLRKYTI